MPGNNAKRLRLTGVCEKQSVNIVYKRKDPKRWLRILF